jgi:hypothetical protein
VDRAVPLKGFGAVVYEEEEERGTEVAKTHAAALLRWRRSEQGRGSRG